MRLTLLTTTGERPLAWSLCERLMLAQTFEGPVRWVVVDDGREAQPLTFERAGWSVEVLRPQPAWAPGQNTQARNLQTGLRAIGADERVVIVEDDDHYAPAYLDDVARRFDAGAELIGEAPARYYNVPQRRARQLHNQRHASLCTTSVAGAALSALRAAAQRSGAEFIDLTLWRSALAARRDLRVLPTGRSPLVHGIKGLPGRAGIGMGHRADLQGVADQGGNVLAEWVGDAWARLYLDAAAAATPSKEDAA